ncbi:MAG: PKD domain-containing protein, partial [Bacteroidales bacterium]|nr:PKD domain-containing protein [Bacteroidales bacterium]
MKKILLNLIAIMIVMGASAQTWNYVTNSGTDYILYGMSFPPDQSIVGYACGMDGTYNQPGIVIKTTDGGDNWTEVWPVTGSIDGLQGIWFIDENVGFASGWNNYFIKTTDGGINWTPVSCGTNVWYYTDVEFWDTDNGVACAYMNSSDQCVFVTDDGGDTWTQATSGVLGNMMAVCYADATTLFAVNTSGNVYKSTDGGHNWTVKSSLPALLFGVDFADANFGVVGAEEKIFATNNGGDSWTTYTTGYENFYATQAFTDGTAYVGGTDERIHVTYDYGVSWQLDHNGAGTSHLYRIRYAPNGTLTACGSQGTIIQREPSLTAAFTADNTAVCEGDIVNFTDMSVGVITSWSWTFEGGTPASSTVQNPAVTYNTSGSYDVSLEVSDGNNTVSTTETEYISVESIPVQATMPSGPDETCTGSIYDYTTSVISNADEYDWRVEPTDAGNMTGTGTTGSFIAATDWTGAYTIKVRGVNECGDGAYSPLYNATLYASPASYFITGGGGYCIGDPGRELILEGSETGVDYELYFDDVSTGEILAGTGDSLNFGYHTDQGFYTVTGYTDHCTQDMPGQAYVYLQFMPATPNIPEGPDMVCNNMVSTYTTSGSLNADTLIWILIPAEAGLLIPGTDMTYVDWDAGYTGTAYLSLYGSNICGDGSVSPELEINVQDAPAPEISGLA